MLKVFGAKVLLFFFVCSTRQYMGNPLPVMIAQALEVPLQGVGSVLRLERDALPMVERPRQAPMSNPPPPAPTVNLCL